MKKRGKGGLMLELRKCTVRLRVKTKVCLKLASEYYAKQQRSHYYTEKRVLLLKLLNINIFLFLPFATLLYLSGGAVAQSVVGLLHRQPGF